MFRLFDFYSLGLANPRENTFEVVPFVISVVISILETAMNLHILK